ncbi:MAG: heat-inducible transcriptional repressor HrcA [Gammaproteobacteria bacterium]
MAVKQVINERAQCLLKALVGRYIRDGQPVSSRTLARDAGLDLSPATVRNVMADLEDLQLVTSPHVSAGRIPTMLGYRFFVDSLLTIESMDSAEVQRLKNQLDPDKNTQGLLETASTLLSEVTHLASVVMLPRRGHATLRQVEFLPLSDNRVLVILVVNEREVQNRIIHTDRAYTPAELQQATNYLNGAFAGQDLRRVKDNLLKEMNEARETMNRMMLAAVEMADKAFTAPPSGDDYVVAGQTNLLNSKEKSDIDALYRLFEAFNQKRDILHLLDQGLKAEGLQIYIGRESGYEMLKDYSVITSPYAVDGQVVGVLGVIGPTRMFYERIIPMVDMTARLLGAALDHRH